MKHARLARSWSEKQRFRTKKQHHLRSKVPPRTLSTRHHSWHWAVQKTELPPPFSLSSPSLRLRSRIFRTNGAEWGHLASMPMRTRCDAKNNRLHSSRKTAFLAVIVRVADAHFICGQLCVCLCLSACLCACLVDFSAKKQRTDAIDGAFESLSTLAGPDLKTDQ